MTAWLAVTIQPSLGLSTDGRAVNGIVPFHWYRESQPGIGHLPSYPSRMGMTPGAW